MPDVLREFKDMNAFLNSEYNELRSYHWENIIPYRPKTYCKIGVVDGNLVANLKCYEENPKAVYTKRDDPMYKDSCLEFFVRPVENKAEYINIESNANGAFLCEFGAGRENRRLVSSFSKSSPIVGSFKGKDENGAFWGVTVEVTKSFVSEIYNISEDEVTFNVVRANFYKCGDDCEIQHYLAFSPVTTLPPGFHNPECFKEFQKI